MYYLGSFGTRSSSKVITVQDRMRALKAKKNDKIIEERKEEEEEEDKIIPEKKEEETLDIQNKIAKEEESLDIRRGQARYISSKYILTLFIFR